MTRKEVIVVSLVFIAVSVFSGMAVLQARASLRDIARLAHLREVQAGLELFFADNGSYPAGLPDDRVALGSTTAVCLNDSGFSGPCSNGDEVYLTVIPSVPQPGLKGKSSCGGVKNAYCYATDEVSFRIGFELERDLPELKLVAGANCLTEKGFRPNACQSYAK